MVELHAGLEQDDHDAPALLVRRRRPLPGGLQQARRRQPDPLPHLEQPGDPNSWRPEQTLARPAATVTYSNLFRLRKENGGKGRIYDFYRGENWNPNFLVSDDDGETWSYGGRLVPNRAGRT